MMMDYNRRYRADGFKPARGRGKKKKSFVRIHPAAAALPFIVLRTNDRRGLPLTGSSLHKQKKRAVLTTRRRRKGKENTK
jgi:hypothetical protein